MASPFDLTSVAAVLVVLGLVPGGLREASLALGGTEWRTTTGVVLPTARTGLTTAVILGVARVIGETAPLILTIGDFAQWVSWIPLSVDRVLVTSEAMFPQEVIDAEPDEAGLRAMTEAAACPSAQARTSCA